MLIRVVLILLIPFIIQLYGQEKEVLIKHQPILANNSLAGSFGELRKNHFHAGIDLKTHRKEGYKVYAVNEGYVSRIKHSEYGYGRAIYINHPSGYTTVYAHLKSFSEEIDSLWWSRVYAEERYYGDFMFEPNELPVSTGDVIALSGNSGSSSAPHLHFEVRIQSSEKPVNPIYYGLKLDDHIAPVLKGLKIETLSPKGIDGVAQERKYGVVSNSKGQYVLQNGPKKISGPFRLSIHARDQWDGSYNWCGVNLLTLCVEDEVCFKMNIDTLDFFNGKFIHSCMDYDAFYTKSQHYLKLYKEAYNPMPFNFQGDLAKDQWIDLEGNKRLDIIIGDAKGNLSELHWEAFFNHEEVPETTSLLACKKEQTFEKDSFKLILPSGTFANDYKLNWEVRTTQMDVFLTDLVRLESDEVWMDSAWIYLLAKRKSDKAILVKVDEGGSKTFQGVAMHRAGYYQVQNYGNGEFAIVEDLDVPILEKYWLTKSGYLCFKAKDERTPLKEPKVYLNENWVPVKYYRRGDYYRLLNKSGGNVKLILKDQVGNTLEENIKI